MIKAIIFDFDGVILESAEIKTDAFRELFRAYPKKIEEITDYHLLNTGISRYVKFRHIYGRILGKELTQKEEVRLGEHFSQLALRKVLKAPFVSGARGFLEQNKQRYQFFIASGTPQEELDKVIRLRKLKGYFQEVHGSPEEKADIIKQIIKDYNFGRQEIVYIGDGASDRIAAKKAKITFIERAIAHKKPKGGQWVMNNLSDLVTVLHKIEKSNLKEGD